MAIGIFVFGGLLFFRDQLEAPLSDFWRESVAPFLATGRWPVRPENVPAPGEAPYLVPPNAIENPEDMHEARQFAPPVPAPLELSISRDFRPVGFQVATRGIPLQLSSEPLPDVVVGPGTARRLWGRVPFASGAMAFFIELRDSGPVLIADENRDGDLDDDLREHVSHGPGYFGVLLKLPLGEISGIPALSGVDYQLWFYASRAELERGVVRHYPRTQLGGSVDLGGQRYPAWLADDRVIDGDYRNDGIRIDLDGDGRINRPQEYFAPGKPVIRGDRAWLPRIVK